MCIGVCVCVCIYPMPAVGYRLVDWLKENMKISKWTRLHLLLFRCALYRCSNTFFQFPHFLSLFSPSLAAWGSLTNCRFAGLSSSLFRSTVIYGFQSDPFAGKCSPNAVPACPANLLGNYVAALLRSIFNSPPNSLPFSLSLSLALCWPTNVAAYCFHVALLRCPALPYPFPLSFLNFRCHSKNF